MWDLMVRLIQTALGTNLKFLAQGAVLGSAGTLLCDVGCGPKLFLASDPCLQFGAKSWKFFKHLCSTEM